MVSRERACLDAEIWFDSLLRLSAWMSAGASIDNGLRLAGHLARLAPPPYRAMVRGLPEEAAFEALVERAAFEEAAIALIGTALSHEVLASTGGVAARVWRTSDGEGMLATADVPAAALVQAWIAFFLSTAGHEPAQATGSSHKSA